MPPRSNDGRVRENLRKMIRERKNSNMQSLKSDKNSMDVQSHNITKNLSKSSLQLV